MSFEKSPNMYEIKNLDKHAFNILLNDIIDVYLCTFKVQEKNSVYTYIGRYIVYTYLN